MTRPPATRPGAPTAAPRPEGPDGGNDTAGAAASHRDGSERPAHRHGTLETYRHDRCRCGPCRAANRAVQRRRRRAIAYGQWQPFVDADPIRAHVSQLAAAGFSLRRIAELSGLSRGCIEALMHGKPARGRSPSQQIRAATAGRLLRVSPPSGPGAGHAARTDAADARRRLQELIALGWSMSRIAEQLHRTHSHISRLLTRQTIAAATDRHIHDVYQRLSAGPPSPTSARERASVNAARRYAAARGWHPPLCPADISPLSEDTYVDVVAVQRAVDGHPVALNAAERLAATTQLTNQGTSAHQIAQRLGTHPRTVHRYRQITQQAPTR
jgi:DNA-binding NarL/FixJ family response regulator